MEVVRNRKIGKNKRLIKVIGLDKSNWDLLVMMTQGGWIKECQGGVYGYWLKMEEENVDKVLGLLSKVCKNV